MYARQECWSWIFIFNTKSKQTTHQQQQQQLVFSHDNNNNKTPLGHLNSFLSPPNSRFCSKCVARFLSGGFSVNSPRIFACQAKFRLKRIPTAERRAWASPNFLARADEEQQKQMQKRHSDTMLRICCLLSEHIGEWRLVWPNSSSQAAIRSVANESGYGYGRWSANSAKFFVIILWKNFFKTIKNCECLKKQNFINS